MLENKKGEGGEKRKKNKTNKIIESRLASLDSRTCCACFDAGKKTKKKVSGEKNWAFKEENENGETIETRY